MYAILAPLVQSADAGLDQQIDSRLEVLLGQVRSLPSLDAVTDKALLLRECAALSQAITRIGAALGLSVTTINLS